MLFHKPEYLPAGQIMMVATNQLIVSQMVRKSTFWTLFPVFTDLYWTLIILWKRKTFDYRIVKNHPGSSKILSSVTHDQGIPGLGLGGSTTQKPQSFLWLGFLYITSRPARYFTFFSKSQVLPGVVRWPSSKTYTSSDPSEILSRRLFISTATSLFTFLISWNMKLSLNLPVAFALRKYWPPLRQVKSCNLEGFYWKNHQSHHPSTILWPVILLNDDPLHGSITCLGHDFKQVHSLG